MTEEYYNRSVCFLSRLENGTINRVELFRLGFRWSTLDITLPISNPDEVLQILFFEAENNCDAIGWYNLGVMFQEGIIRHVWLWAAEICFEKAKLNGMNVSRELNILKDLRNTTIS